jgi:MoaD family protein
MFVKVKFFAYFRETFGAKEREIEFPAGAMIGALLDAVADTPSRRAELFDGPALKPHLIILVNGASLSSRGGLAGALRDGDVVAVFPMMGGG